MFEFRMRSCDGTHTWCFRSCSATQARALCPLRVVRHFRLDESPTSAPDAAEPRAGLALSLEDRVRARAIEMLMCDFALDLRRLGVEFGDFASIAAKGMEEAARAFPEHVRLSEAGLEIVSEGPLLARLVSRFFDVHAGEAQSCGQAV